MLIRRSALISETLGSISPFDGITIFVAWLSCITASLFFLPNAQGIVGASLAVLMIAIAFVDARRFIIPDELTAAAMALGFLHAALQASGSIVEALANAALRGAILAFAFLTLRILYRRLRGRDGIGLGDVKLAGVAGVWVDWSGPRPGVGPRPCASTSTHAAPRASHLACPARPRRDRRGSCRAGRRTRWRPRSRDRSCRR